MINEMVSTIMRWSEDDFADIGAAAARDFPEATDLEIDEALEVAATRLAERGRAYHEEADEMRAVVHRRNNARPQQ